MVHPPSRLCVHSGLMIAVCLAPTAAFSAGGTAKIASEGQPVSPRPNWPEGLAAVVNDPGRTDGWNSWFTEWPNDVVHYQFRLANTDEVNALLRKFAKVQSENLRVHLSPLSEPRGFGWVSSLPEGNGTPVMLSLGDQEQIDDWFRRLPGGKFGVMEFEKTPIAVPPTLTLYTRNKAIDLDRLEIPENIEVSIGDLPRVFHKANTRSEREAAQKPQTTVEVEPTSDPDRAAEELKKQIERLKALLAERKQRLGKELPAAESKADTDR